MSPLVAITYVKGKIHPVTCHEGIAALDGGGSSASPPGPFTPEKKPVCLFYSRLLDHGAGLGGCGISRPPCRGPNPESSSS